MKKLVSVFLTAALLVTMLAACGGDTAPETTAPVVGPVETTAPVTTAPAETTAPAVSGGVEGSVEELLNSIIAIEPVEFMGGTLPIDLADTSEDGLWNLKRYTGLDKADDITEAAVFEPMMGSIAYSMVAVRVAEGADAKTVAETMKNGIDPAKWVCVCADELKVAASGDVVMLIMVDSMSGLSAQSFVDAFQQVAGSVDFVI